MTNTKNTQGETAQGKVFLVQLTRFSLLSKIHSKHTDPYRQK